jgi:hypothetical protein
MDGLQMKLVFDGYRSYLFQLLLYVQKEGIIFLFLTVMEVILHLNWIESALKTIPLCMPPHLSHLLQPLDIGYFAVLKRSYSRLVENQARTGYNHIDKLDFLAAYPQARAETFKLETIQNSFAAAGLVPINAYRVLSGLNISLRTPTPPRSRPSSRSSVFFTKNTKNSSPT